MLNKYNGKKHTGGGPSESSIPVVKGTVTEMARNKMMDTKERMMMVSEDQPNRNHLVDSSGFYT
jgi:hypothetical protein